MKNQSAAGKREDVPTEELEQIREVKERFQSMGKRGKRLTGKIAQVFKDKYLTQTNLINNVKHFQGSKHVRGLLSQIGERSSVINQGDIYIQKRNERQAVHLSNYDNTSAVPTQLWYDQLR